MPLGEPRLASTGQYSPYALITLSHDIRGAFHQLFAHP